MPKSNESKYFSASFTESQGLRSYFGNVVKGQPEVYNTPFAKGESTKEMLGRWNAILKSIDKRWPSLYKYEIDLAKKVGPMSVMLPLEDRMSDIDSYYDGISLPSTDLENGALKAVISEFSQIRGLSVRGEARTVELMKKSTNSGSPFFTKRRLVTDKTVPCSVTHNRDFVDQYLPAGWWSAAAVLGWRGQEGGPSTKDVKQRVVWMFPYAVNVKELQVYQPLIEAAQRFNLVPAWVSMESVDRRITDMFDTKSDDDLVVCTDFSKFDQHFNKSMQDAAKTILASILDGSKASRDWLTDVFPIKYMIPLAYDWNKVRFGSHGMGSGSGGTNCDETLAHRALQYEAARSAGEHLNPNSQCLGDDGIITYPGITVEDVVKAYTSHGLEMNPDKQYAATQDCTYLRRWHHKDYRMDGVCVGVYSTCRALGRLRYLERFQDPRFWDAKAVALRQLSILENVKYHPLREEFVDFCMKRDKYRLGRDIPHFLDDVQAIAQEKIDSMPDFLGYTKTLQSQGDPVGGISDWWIVNYLKSV
uniref:RNA-dependent RNA polymerase n=1 Tax=Shelduck picobirnavirus II TaxID=2212780 RepID=A0A3G1RPI3_9VIRU|nr:MAG: RNA-dependent RNA polymerase [Shelduck picobirnavirus II]